VRAEHRRELGIVESPPRVTADKVRERERALCGGQFRSIVFPMDSALIWRSGGCSLYVSTRKNAEFSLDAGAGSVWFGSV